jgi:hypothetical protein
MYKRISIILNKISFLQAISIDDILKVFLANPYNEEDGIGFTKAELFDNVLEATLIKRTPTSLQEFDFKSGDFIQRDIFVFDEITFYIDLGKSLIYTFNTISKFNKVKTNLKNYIQNRIIYENIELNPKNIIDNLIVTNFDCTISEIVIKNFIYNQGAQGKYVAHILDAKTGQELMDKYIDEIQKVTLEISSDLYDDFRLIITTNNALSIKSKEDDFFCILDNIKNQISK